MTLRLCREMSLSRHQVVLVLLLLFCWFPLCYPVGGPFITGFWYGDSRPPVTNYDSVSYANMSVKINRRIDEGPGQNLVRDPARGKYVDTVTNKTGTHKLPYGFPTNKTIKGNLTATSDYNPDEGLFVGNTINRQTFVTQFVLDMSYALGIWQDRIFVTNILPGDVHFSWESTSVIVYFFILERNGTYPNAKTLLEAIADLSAQIQDPTTRVYVGTNVTVDIDPLWGLVVDQWDVSLKLTYPIENIGGIAVQDGYYIDQGSLGTCDRPGAWTYFYYCEFERFFEDDVSLALNISYYRVHILFVKRAAVDAVLIHFRISPPNLATGEGWKEMSVNQAVANLTMQVKDFGIILQDATLYPLFAHPS